MSIKKKFQKEPGCIGSALGLASRSEVQSGAHAPSHVRVAWRHACHWVVVVLVCWFAGLLHANDHWHLEASGLSRYVYQGLEVVSDDPALQLAFASQWQRIKLHGDWVTVPGASYDKSRLGLGYVVSWQDYRVAPVETELGVRRKGVSNDGVDDDAWEVFGFLAWTLEAGLIFDVDAYFELDGDRLGFVLMGFERTFALSTYTPSTITPGVRLGLDAGAVSGSRRIRDNHLEFSLDFSFQATKRVALLGGASHSLGLSAIDDASPDAGNETWGRVGLQCTF